MNISDNQTLFTIGEFVKVCGTTRDTIYHYERQGLISPIVNEQNGYRYYKLEDYYTYMYVAHLIRIGFSLREIQDIVADKRLNTYLETMEISNRRLTEQREQLRLRQERTQRGFWALEHSVGHPINTPQIAYRDETYFLRAPFAGDRDGKDSIRAQAKLRQYAEMHGIEIEGHYLGFCMACPSPASAKNISYVMLKLYKNSACELSYTRPSGVYISMFYKGPFADKGNETYAVMEQYMTEHRFTPKSDLFLEDIVGPFLSTDTSEYIGEMSVLVE